MSKTMNKVTLFGNVGRVESVQTQSGMACCRISLATSTGGYTKKDGTEVQEVTQWHRIVCFGSTAEFIVKYVGQGEAKDLTTSQLLIEGHITYNTVEKDGHKTTYTDIIAEEVYLGGRKQQAQQENNQPQAQFAQPYQQQAPQQFAQPYQPTQFAQPYNGYPQQYPPQGYQQNPQGNALF